MLIRNVRTLRHRRLTGHVHRTAVPVLLNRQRVNVIGSPCRAGDRGARTQFAIDVENRRRIALDQTELGDDFARDLLFFDLLGQEPLELGHLGERLLLEAQFVKSVDLDGYALFVHQGLFEDRGQRVERSARLIDGLEIDSAIADARSSSR